MVARVGDKVVCLFALGRVSAHGLIACALCLRESRNAYVEFQAQVRFGILHVPLSCLSLRKTIAIFSKP